MNLEHTVGDTVELRKKLMFGAYCKIKLRRKPKIMIKPFLQKKEWTIDPQIHEVHTYREMDVTLIFNDTLVYSIFNGHFRKNGGEMFYKEWKCSILEFVYSEPPFLNQ